jgi:glycosyltransferase involved in cell wall biosynthesis
VFRELNQRAKCLQLVTPNAVHELAWQIKRVMSSPALQQELVEAAHAYVRRSSCAAVAESTRKIYENLVRSSVGLDYSQAA